MIVVSKCLLGYNCKYNGKNNYNQKVIDYLKDKEYIAVCAEELGGLPTPRYPSERYRNKVINNHGQDVSLEFYSGAKKAYEIVENYDIEFAILKHRSPSCGYGKIYDGSFQSKLIEGNGCFAEILDQNNIVIYNENSMLPE